MRIETTKGGRDYAKIGRELTKAVGAAVPILISGQTGAGLGALSASVSAIVDLTCALYESKTGKLGASAWSLVSSAYALGLAKLIATAPIARRPIGAELETLITSLLSRAKIAVDSQPQELSLDALYSPLKIPFIRKAVKDLPHELSLFALDCPINDCRVLFENCMIDALTEVRNNKPDLFKQVEDALSGAFAHAMERKKALGQHHDFIIKSFSLRPVFGQEETGITLEDLYVRQRALWNTKQVRQQSTSNSSTSSDTTGNFFQDEIKNSSKWQFPLHVGDLHETLWHWLSAEETGDTIRVVAGGPGSGKSTFARALAIEVIENGTYDVLFVPLQEIEATGTFTSRVENLFRNRTDLGLDRVENPLNWLGQRDPDGRAPDRPLLIICDGLDEIAPPGSSEAATVTTDFIQTLGSWINNRNSGGLFVKAIVLGRTISAQEAFRKLSVNHQALIRVAGLLPLNSSEEWLHADAEKCLVDAARLSKIDQRQIFWENWCLAANLKNEGVPQALQAEAQAAKALIELTAEPLLLYLLLWTGYLGENWEKAAANRNHVYEAIFKQIYARRWGQDGEAKALANRERGGHSGTNDLAQEDFFLLQEALGLASWATGGRIVTSEAFQIMLRLYLDQDKYDDLADGLSSSLKSVALQSYTRSIAADNAGFEFVHKTIGEYLIARGLASWLTKSVEPLRTRISEGRCKDSANLMSKIFWRGSLTVEIARFFEDEIKIRFPEEKIARSFIEERLVPVGSWVLKNGMPVHNAPGSQNDQSTYAMIEQAEHRSLDVFWTALQSVAKSSYKLNKLGESSAEMGWIQGPIKLDWPSPYSFQSLFSKLSSLSLISESQRLPSFDYLDLKNQAVTDNAFGGVIFSYDEQLQAVSPRTWLRISLFAADLSGLQFYGANLREANLRFSNLEGATLFGANLKGAQLSNVNLRSADLARASLADAILTNSDLSYAQLAGATFTGCEMVGVSLDHANFDPDQRGSTGNSSPAVFYKTDLTSCECTNVRFDKTIIVSSSFDRSNFYNCEFGDTLIVDCSFNDVTVDDQTRERMRIAKNKSARIQKRLDRSKNDASFLIYWRSEVISAVNV